MIRFEIALRFTLLGGLFVPAFVEGQDSTTPTQPKPSRESRTEPRETPASPLIRDLDENVFANHLDPAGGLDGPSKWKVSVFRSTSPDTIAWGTRPDTLEWNFGLKLAPVDDALRAQLDLPAGQGVVAVEVKPGGLAEQAGLKANDVLIRLGEHPVSGVDQARGLFLVLGKEALEVNLIREGKPRRMSLVGPEHGFPPESSEYWIGVPVSPVDATLRSHLADLPPDAGLIANDVVKDSPADRSGVKKNDILVLMAGKPLKTPDSLIEQIQASGGKPVSLAVVRAGKPVTVEVTPARRAHPTPIVLTREGRIRLRLLQPRAAVEFDPNLSRKDVAGQQGAARGMLPARLLPWKAQAAPFETNSSKKYDAIVVNPHNVEASRLSGGSDRPIGLQLDLSTSAARGDADPAMSRIEAQLKELTARMDGIIKALDGLKKTNGP